MRDKLKNLLEEFVQNKGLVLKGTFSVFSPENKEFGDFSTNLAFKIESSGRKIPEVASELRSMLSELPWAVEMCEKIEQRNGFLNFFLKHAPLQSTIGDVLTAGSDYGRSDAGKGNSVLIEFVSANPTGPLTIAHGRQAAYGEALARALSFAGWEVTKEYYLNDCGRQMEMLGESLRIHFLQLRGKQLSFPEDGYRGKYLQDIAKTLPDSYESADTAAFLALAKEAIIASIKKDLRDFDVHFDSWVNESTLRENGKVEETLEMLAGKSLTYEKDGALWFCSTRFGDDKDRVLRKQDGSYTYLAPDIAYHREKILRNYTHLVNIWGPDHNGYIPRMKAALAAFGFSVEHARFITVQLTTLYRGAEKISMSTRRGEFISLRELIEEVGPDAAKFFFLFRRADSHLDFDLELAKKKTDENPIYYLQYGFVRAQHILNHAIECGYVLDEAKHADFSLLSLNQERELVKKITSFPRIIEQISGDFEISRLAHYLHDLARLFHSYYQKVRVVTDNREVSLARIALTQCFLHVVQNGLQLLGISRPDRM